MFKFVFLLILIFTALLVIFIKFLPWWGSLLLLLGLAFGVRFGAGYLFKSLLTLPFKAKGKALAGAKAELHGVRVVRPPHRKPDPDSEDVAEETEYLRQEQEEDARLRWYLLDMTIAPQNQKGGFSFWEPGELMLVDMNAKPLKLEDEQPCKLDDYRIFQDGTFQQDDIGKHQGPQRLKLHVGLPPTIQQFQLRYYFELFGRITLPSA